LRAENLSSNNVQSYEACPYCLTEIVVENSSATVEDKEKLSLEKPNNRQTSVPRAEEHLTNTPKPQGCKHHLGYLSQRQAKEQIPEECMMCTNIVKCMLKAVTG
jgi:hypothetical protein